MSQFNAMAWGDLIRDEHLDELLERAKDSQTVLLRIDQFRDLVLQAKSPLSDKYKELEQAVRWVLTDAAYKPPELIGDIPERWINRLREVIAT